MAYSVDIYDNKGKVVSKINLEPSIFADEFVNESLIHEYYLLQTSNARKNIAKAKSRGEVHGSGKKLYKQKGTGNARVGGKQSPIRKGGGVAFGPTAERSYLKYMNKKSKKLALNGILTLKAKEKQILGLQDFEMNLPKTKSALDILKNVGLKDKKLLFVLNEKNENISKSFRNLENLKCLLVNYLNPYDLMNCDNIIFVESALNTINKIKKLKD
ncbi:MAG: 50S ribosomal protein L4 [Candidatus Absconditabacterales bacterium]